jgi:hypothetical protein
MSNAPMTRAITGTRRDALIRLTRYGWNFAVIFYGIIPFNSVASLAIAR